MAKDHKEVDSSTGVSSPLWSITEPEGQALLCDSPPPITLPTLEFHRVGKLRIPLRPYQEHQCLGLRRKKVRLRFGSSNIDLKRNTKEELVVSHSNIQSQLESYLSKTKTRTTPMRRKKAKRGSGDGGRTRQRGDMERLPLCSSKSLPKLREVESVNARIIPIRGRTSWGRRPKLKKRSGKSMKPFRGSKDHRRFYGAHVRCFVVADFGLEPSTDRVNLV